MSKTIKTSDLRPCDNCGGSISPIFYRLEIQFRQLAINQTAVNQVMGTAQIFGGNLTMGALMSPNEDAAIEMPGYQVDKDLFLCADCLDVSIRPIDLMVEAEGDGRE